MSIPVLTTPPDQRTPYIIDQLEGECITIPGSKGVFRILASSKQTQGGIAVFSNGGVLSEAPGFHWHAEAHDVFLPIKGFLKLWNGDKCRIMGPGDFAYVPPVSRPPEKPYRRRRQQSRRMLKLNPFSRKSYITPSFSDHTPNSSASSLPATGLTSSAMFPNPTPASSSPRATTVTSRVGSSPRS